MNYHFFLFKNSIEKNKNVRLSTGHIVLQIFPKFALSTLRTASIDNFFLIKYYFIKIKFLLKKKIKLPTDTQESEEIHAKLEERKYELEHFVQAVAFAPSEQ